MEQKIRGDVFDTIRQAMKSQNMTYTGLADKMNVSEATIKRLFADKDCKVSRLLEICDCLNIAIADVLDSASRPDAQINQLPKSLEMTLAARPSLFYLLILLRDNIPMEDVIRRYGLDQADIVLYARDLERLGLVEQDPSGKINVIMKQPVRFRQNGPLSKIIKRLNADFIADLVDRNENDTDMFFAFSRKMHKETARLIKQELDELTNRISNMARQDQSLSKEEDLLTYKLCLAWGDIQFQDLFRIEPHPEKQPIENRPQETRERSLV